MPGHQKIRLTGLKSTFFHGFSGKGVTAGASLPWARAGRCRARLTTWSQRRDDFGIMGGKHERAAVRRDAQQPGQHEFASDRILLGGRLVGE